MTIRDPVDIWRERLNQSYLNLGRGVEPETLADRYDAETEPEIQELTNLAYREMLRRDNGKVTLDDLDAAAEKIAESGNGESATSGGEVRGNL